MAKTAVINIRAEAETKTAIEALFSQFGITVSDAVNMFFHKALMEGGLPFEVKIPMQNIKSGAQHKNAFGLPDVLPTSFYRQLTLGLQEIFRDKLTEIYLYGSYARGEQQDDSDVDIAVLVDLDRASMQSYGDQIVDLAVELDLEFDTVTSINCIPDRDYSDWKTSLPYYRSIDEEGVSLYAA